MRSLWAFGLALLAAGCAGTDPQPRPVTIAGDTYCDIARKVTWSIHDTRETIDAARRANAQWDCLCLPQKPAYCRGAARTQPGSPDA